jgi:RNA polymerase sigma-70 factor (ECF subfamily)
MGGLIMLINSNRDQAETGEEIMSQCVSTMGESYDLAGFSAEAQPAVAGYVSSDSYRQTRKRKPAREEAGLIERLKAGDERALEAIFNLYSTRLYNVAWRILGDVAETEEVIQDVFWTAYRKAKTFRGNSQFSTWLYRLTINAALGRIRRSKKNKEVEYDEFLPKFQEDGHHLVRPVVDWSDTLDENYAKREIQQLLNTALEQLKPLDKSVVVLSDLEGMSDKEIAAALRVTVSAVKTRLHRARLFLRGKLAVQLGHSAA